MASNFDANKMQIAIKQCFVDWKFDGLFGFFITAKNFLRGEFNSSSHTEFKFSALYGGISFSSIETDTDAEGKTVKGCRFKQIEYSNPKSWHFYDYDPTQLKWPKWYPDEQHVMEYTMRRFFPQVQIRLTEYPSPEECREFCLSAHGRGYDIEGIIGQAISQNEVENPTKFFCSESTNEIINHVNKHPSPAALEKMLQGIERK